MQDNKKLFNEMNEYVFSSIQGSEII
jgi:hypothetical protein